MSDERPGAVESIHGVRVGHWTDHEAQTGCTVVLFPEGTVGSGEVRGGAPASREFELLAPERSVAELHAVCLSGRSTFGLAACDGVVRDLEAQGIGFATPGGPVPIVVGLSLFDLTVGDASVRPGPAQGADAVRGASDTSVVTGLVGAGTGATVGKWGGVELAVPGGLGAARVEQDGVTMLAIMAVNAAGWIDDGTERQPHRSKASFGANTTIGLVVTDASLDKVGCLRAAQGGHDGLARAIVPAHTGVDGDAIVAAATGSVDGEADLDLVRWMAAVAVEQAIRSLDQGSDPANG